MDSKGKTPVKAITSDPQPDYQQPAAYDANGQPLYARPPVQTVYMARAPQPESQLITPEVLKKHKDSKVNHPDVNLSEGEFVISAVRRHLIGLLSIWGVVAAIILITLVVIPIYSLNSSLLDGFLGGGALGLFILIMLVVDVLFVLGGIIAMVVYRGNKFYLTNESVIQCIQTSLFSKKEQTISLINIEDASFNQRGILQHLFNYGSLRLSTQGEETTYRFNYVSEPKKQIDMLNNAVEAFKNGRPIDEFRY